jgi:anti-sigma B factor antagonist
MVRADEVANPPLSVHVEQGDGRPAVISARGEIDMATAPQLEEAFVLCGQAGDVLIDLTEVTFLDSSALKVLVDNAKKLSRAGHQFRLKGLSELQRRVVHLTGLDEVLNVTDAI